MASGVSGRSPSPASASLIASAYRGDNFAFGFSRPMPPGVRSIFSGFGCSNTGKYSPPYSRYRHAPVVIGIGSPKNRQPTVPSGSLPTNAASSSIVANDFSWNAPPGDMVAEWNCLGGGAGGETGSAA